jgi:hypothetical protein
MPFLVSIALAARPACPPPTTTTSLDDTWRYLSLGPMNRARIALEREACQRLCEAVAWIASARLTLPS